MSVKEKIQTLNEKLIEWSKHYYENNESLVSDQQYDATYFEYKDLVEQNPTLEPENSILKQVGSKVDDRFKKVNHVHPMLSLDNAFNDEDIIRFDKHIKDQLHVNGDIEYALELKIDGLSISLHYNQGKLVQAVTRGDGNIGEDVTHNALVISDIPKQIEYKGSIEFRGEVYMQKSIFERLNTNGAELANPRNAASGSLRQLDSSVAKQRQLSCFIYSIPNPLDHNLHSQADVIDFVIGQGFSVSGTKIAKGVEEIISAYQKLLNQRATLNFDVDGVVVKVNNIDLYEDIGYTVKYPKFMIAYKFPEEIASTELLRIFPTIGRTGKITYNAELSPVRLAGTTVAAATLHNPDYVLERNINVGDFVNVKKSGDIIPRVLGVSKKVNTSKWTEETLCPSCQSELKRMGGEVDQYCVNKLCEAKVLAAFEHFVSRKALNIEGVSVELIKTFIEHGLVTDLASLFALPTHRDEIIMLPNFKEKSTDNVIKAINKAKKTELRRLLFALGIRHVGSKNAALLAKRFSSLENVMQISRDDITKIRELGPKVAQSVVEYFSSEENKLMIQEMINNGLEVKGEADSVSSIFEGKTFVITGTLSQSRDYFKNIIELNSGNVSTSISKNTDYLLVGDNAGSKLDKANSLGVAVINEVELNRMLGGDNA